MTEDNAQHKEARRVITIGIDPHKRTHTAVAVNDVGQQLEEITFPADEEGQRRFLAWAHELEGEGELRFALEDCRHVNGPSSASC